MCSIQTSLLTTGTALAAAPEAQTEVSCRHDVAATGLIALIAAYNEARFIGSVVISARRHVETVIVVNDGSQDETSAIARSAGAVVIDLPENRGKSMAIQQGLEAALSYPNARGIVLLDGDGQHDPTEILAIVEPILHEGADIVVGSRFKEIRSAIPWWRQIGQHGLTWATNVASGVALSDSQSGFRALSVDAARSLTFRGRGFSVESEMQFAAREYGLTIQEVPISCVYAEPPKRNPVSHGMQVLDGILKMVLQMRPLFFFGILAAVVLVSGFLLGLRVVTTFQSSAQLAVGTGLLTVMLIIMGSIFLSTGFTLHSIRSFLADRLER